MLQIYNKHYRKNSIKDNYIYYVNFRLKILIFDSKKERVCLHKIAQRLIQWTIDMGLGKIFLIFFFFCLYRGSRYLSLFYLFIQ